MRRGRLSPGVLTALLGHGHSTSPSLPALGHSMPMGKEHGAAWHSSAQGPRRSVGTATNGGTEGVPLRWERLLENSRYWSGLQDDSLERNTATEKNKEQNTIWCVKKYTSVKEYRKKNAFNLMNVPQESLKRNEQKQTYHVGLFNCKTMRKQLWTTQRTFQLQEKKGFLPCQYLSKNAESDTGVYKVPRMWLGIF